MISTIIHTYNEEKNISRALESASFSDEIIIIDMGSVDKTLEIAKKFNTRIFNHPYVGFVEPARNFGIEQAKNEWIFILDADEIITKKLANTLINISKKSNYDYFRIPRKNIIFGKWIKHAGWWPDYQIRFFKKNHVKWMERLHSIPVTNGIGFDLEAEESLSILHNNYQNIEQFILRMHRYTSVSAKQQYQITEKIKIDDIVTKPMKEFIRRFIIWEGYKDGYHGLFLSLLQSFSELLVYVKIWEMEKYSDHKISLKNFEELQKENFFENIYWLNNKRSEGKYSLKESIVFKFVRRILKYV
jgi:(heptosyl)LPS beta-1,4-glucosyltransferase